LSRQRLLARKAPSLEVTGSVLRAVRNTEMSVSNMGWRKWIDCSCGKRTALFSQRYPFKLVGIGACAAGDSQELIEREAHHAGVYFGAELVRGEAYKFLFWDVAHGDWGHSAGYSAFGILAGP
jgi:hypothetical protein